MIFIPYFLRYFVLLLKIKVAFRFILLFSFRERELSYPKSKTKVML
jgi:hypothetical protein